MKLMVWEPVAGKWKVTGSSFALVKGKKASVRDECCPIMGIFGHSFVARFTAHPQLLGKEETREQRTATCVYLVNMVSQK